MKILTRDDTEHDVDYVTNAVLCSPCCGANLQVAGDYFEGTRWYQCALCLKDCDPIQVRQLGKVWAARRGYNTALGGTKLDAIRGILDQANAKSNPRRYRCFVCRDTGETDGAFGFNGYGPCPACSLPNVQEHTTPRNKA